MALWHSIEKIDAAEGMLYEYIRFITLTPRVALISFFRISAPV